MNCESKDYFYIILSVLFMLLELWMGKRQPFKAGSTLALVYQWFKGLIAITRIIREKKMKVAEGVDVSYEGGEVILKGVLKDSAGVEIGSAEVKAKVGYVINPKLDEVIAKVQSGEIDLIPGTDLEKPVVLQVLQGLKNELNK